MSPEREFEFETRRDAELDRALKNFRSSVHAWSEAELSRPRVPSVVRSRSWRLAVGWALGVVLAAGGVSGGVYDLHMRKMARIAAIEREQEHQRELAAQKAHAEEELAKVDKAVARDVPTAMEPLAQLMGDDEQ